VSRTVTEWALAVGTTIAAIAAGAVAVRAATIGATIVGAVAVGAGHEPATGPGGGR
jgi:hypothetical protein